MTFESTIPPYEHQFIAPTNFFGEEEAKFE